MPKYKIEIEIEAEDKNIASKAMESMGMRAISIKRASHRRSNLQNNALHLWCTQLAEALNESGQDMKDVIRVDIPWSSYTVKEHLVRPVMNKLLHKDSTTELTSDEVTTVYEVINRALAGRLKEPIHIPFPSEETLLNSLKK